MAPPEAQAQLSRGFDISENQHKTLCHEMGVAQFRGVRPGGDHFCCRVAQAQEMKRAVEIT